MVQNNGGTALRGKRRRKRAAEKPEQAQAFERYYQLGAQRSIRLLSDDLGLPKSTLQMWCKKFDWPTRVRERDTGVVTDPYARQLAQEAETYDNMGPRLDLLIKQVFISVGSFFELQPDGTVKPKFAVNNPNDLRNLAICGKELILARGAVSGELGPTDRDRDLVKAQSKQALVDLWKNASAEERMLLLSHGREEELNVVGTDAGGDEGGDEGAGDVGQGDGDGAVHGDADPD